MSATAAANTLRRHYQHPAEPHDPLPDDSDVVVAEQRERDEAYSNSVIAAGQSAWRRLKASTTSLSDHRLVGQALVQGRKICMAKSNTDKPRGIRYVTTFAAWLKEKNFDDIQKTRRTCSMCVAEYWVEIQAAMKTLSPARRSQMNDCTVVWRWFRSHNKQPKSNGRDGKDPGWRNRKAITLNRAKEAIAAVTREAPELGPDVARDVAFAVMRACGIAIPRELVRAPVVELHSISA
jgi:hypothetical protein